MSLVDDDGRYELHMCHCESCGRVRKAIQLDAYKAGMTEAAELSYNCNGLSSDASQAILTARDNKTSL